MSASDRLEWESFPWAAVLSSQARATANQMNHEPNARNSPQTDRIDPEYRFERGLACRCMPARCRSWVIRIIFGLVGECRLFTQKRRKKRTCGMSEKCHNQTWRDSISVYGANHGCLIRSAYDTHFYGGRPASCQAPVKISVSTEGVSRAAQKPLLLNDGSRDITRAATAFASCVWPSLASAAAKRQ
jgi:hypothetical protein